MYRRNLADMVIANHHAGFTLAELLLCMAVLSIAATFSIAGMRDLQAEVVLRSSSNELAHAFHVARQHSHISGRNVALCPSSDELQCDYTRGWQHGWLVFNSAGDAASPQVPDSASIMLHASGIPHIRISANRPAFVMRPYGRRSTNGTFVFCDPRQRAEARRLVISYTGKPRIEPAPEHSTTCTEPT